METRKKTALVLGGGGARGAYEIGVWQALRETGHQIDMVFGASVGAINGAMVVQDAFDLAVTLWKEAKVEMVIDTSLIKSKKSPLRKLLEQYVDEAAIRSSGIDYGLVTIEVPSLTPHHLFLSEIPEGKLIDFIQASAALVPAFRPQDIDNVMYVDGGFADNLPVDMAIKKKADRIFAVDLDSGIKRKDSLKQAENLVLIRSKWDLGSILDLDGKKAGRFIRLGYLDGLKALGLFDGVSYCFSKGEMDRRSLETAEAAGRIFALDPQLIYTKNAYSEHLGDSVRRYQADAAHEINGFVERMKNVRPEIEHLPKLLSMINSRSVTLILADLMKHHHPVADSIMAKPLLAVFKEEAHSAAYLLKEGLL